MQRANMWLGLSLDGSSETLREIPHPEDRLRIRSLHGRGRISSHKRQKGAGKRVW